MLHREQGRKEWRQLAFLIGVLATLVVLTARPFGFKTFLEALANNSPYSLALLIAIVGISFVLAYRLGILNVKVESKEGINNQLG